MNEIERIIEIMENGGVIVYPTDTLYALGANIFNEKGIKRIYKIKKRPQNVPFSICVNSVDKIKKYAFVNELAEKLIHKFMPGAITIILKKREIVPDYISKDKIAIRVPANSIARKIASKFPVTATSANVHGRKAARTIEEARIQIGDNADAYIDGGELEGIASTIVDVSEDKIKIVREGAISGDEINV